MPWDCTASTVHCQKYFFEHFQKCSSYKDINISQVKLCQKSIFGLIFSYEDNQCSHLFLLNNTQMLVYIDIEI
jgi:hypothetical protein